MKTKKKLIIIISLILFIAIGIGVFVLITSYQMSLIPAMSFEEMLLYTTKDNKNALITVGTIKNGESSFTVYGENASVLPNHEFDYEIGSITKTFTAALLCKTIDEGQLQLSDSIDQYIDLPQRDYYPTFERLMTHTSGYKNYYFDWQMANNFLKREKNSYYGISTDALNQKIGEIALEDKDYAFNYSNFGISVVGSALANLYESDYTTLMNGFIRDELKLENTNISDGSGDLSGYWHWMPNDAYIPAGAIVSTIGDMLQYLELHMSEELPYLAFGHKALAQTLTSNKQYEGMGIRFDAIGTGWIIDTENNIIWHNGGTSHFNSYIAFDKERQIGVVVLSNLAPNYRLPATVMGVNLITALQNEVGQ